MPDYAKDLMTFGEMEVVRSIAKVKSKLDDWGKTCMFLGYAQNHNGGTYCMLNIQTKRISLSSDVIWLNKTYIEYVSRKENTKADSYILQKKTSPINGLT